MAVRPRRSVLYMPGSNARALEKAKSLPADGLILDLEDAVAPDRKAEARQQVVDAVVAGGYGGRELIVRINALDTPWGADDVKAVATCPADAVLIPKVTQPADVTTVLDGLTAAGAPDTLPVWVMMETPLAALRADAIAASSPRLTGMVMGTSDLAKDLHCHHTPDREPMITALGLCLLAARGHGQIILDGVYLDLSDDEGFGASCHQGVQLGFDGKTLIHPKTIEACNAAFSPSEADVGQARRIIAAHAEAAETGAGVVVLDGKLVENLHVVEAERVVAIAEAIEAA